ncbi:hypothetical protein [Krasilnikoviella flava]|uniref:hypothetical protein n=1 Tax=Krasilnikoviella flava TaxID=526729 RepID=UPI0009A58329|nr:hypothetical protein [Krasilnikoviella flava]
MGVRGRARRDDAHHRGRPDYRVVGGDLEIYYDTAADTYGAGSWSREVCPGDGVTEALAGC